MASTTTNIGLTKPAGTDQALISAINGNMDIIDTKMGAVGNTSVQSQITSLSDQIAVQDISNNISISSSKANISQKSAYITGNVISISFIVATTQALSANENLDITATFANSKYKPKNRQPGSSNSTSLGSVNISPTTAGADLVARTISSLPSGFTTWLCYTYICNG